MKQVIPMLNAVNKKGDEKENQVMKTIEARLQALKSDNTMRKDLARVIEILCKRINDYSYWSVLYCLYWMKLRPKL